jgi:hypothetical protein
VNVAAPAATESLLARLYWGLAAVILVGYAIGGRSFAYLQLGGVYIGEMLLAAGCMAAGWAVLTERPRGRSRCRTVLMALAALVAWCVFCTVPHLPVYGADTLRDAATYGYSAFAIVTYSLLRRNPRRLALLVRAYGRYARWFPYVALVLVVMVAAGVVLPEVAPGVGLLVPKAGDLGVHLAGIIAFLGYTASRSSNVVQLTAICCAALSVLTINRGGGLAVLFAMGALWKHGFRALKTFAAVAAIAAVVMMVIVILDVRITFFQNRELSPRQLLINLTSLTESDREMSGNVLETRRWRISWWRQIVDYTVFGEYFWMGKGFGIALGTEDGVTVDRRLRSPHNIWMTYLSRTGVPGVILWTLVVLLWGILLLRASRAAQQSGAQQLSRLAYFLFVFGCAFLINGFFDVYLEGPMGAVWFWTVFGAGLAVIDACRTPLAPGGKRPLVVLPLTALTKREGRVVRRSTSPESTG